MARITISLPSELADALKREARRLGVPVSELVRKALEHRASRPKRLGFIGIGQSSERHTARNMEELLEREWGHARRR